LENAKKAVAEFEYKSKKIREVSNSRKTKFQKKKLSEKYTARILYKWDDEKFEEKYLKKLERNWQKWKLISLVKS